MPAYSIGKSPKNATNNNNIPGVGAYDCSQYVSSKAMRTPTFIIGRQLRLKTEKIYGPGPMDYDTTKKSDFIDKSKGFHITCRLRERIRSQGPGPASYSIPKFPSKKYSFGLKAQVFNRSQNFPGPGKYEIQKIKNSCAISFQQSKRPSLQGSPRYKAGPGDYNINCQNQTKNKFSFPHRNKFFEEDQQEKYKTKIPGPGTYSNVSINSIKKQILAVRFGKSKRDFTNRELNIPGPGAYSPTNSIGKKSPIATIGNSPKALQPLNRNPAPSAYNLTQLNYIKKKQPSIKFGKSHRNQFNSQAFNKIGPGSYNIDDHDRGHAYSISGRIQQQKILKTPGPTSYSPKYQSQFRKIQNAIIPKQQKFHEPNQKIPGPGTYNIGQFKIKSKTFYFPKQNRKNSFSDNPGPGTYQIKQLIGNQVNQ